jgi:hypothetical protein
MLPPMYSDCGSLMRNRTHSLLHIGIITLFVMAGGLPTGIAAPPPAPKSVADFFLLVPTQYMPYYDVRFRKELLDGKHRGAIVDIPNGFISWDASDNTEYFEFALFRKSDGGYLVAYSVPYDDQFPDASHFLLLSYDHGRWRDDTKTLLPVAYKKTHTYNLPRHGTHIEVVAPDGEKLYTLVWVNDRFVMRRSPRK